MSQKLSDSKTSVVSSELVPFIDRRSGIDRRHAADAAAGGVSPWADRRKGDRRKSTLGAAILCVSALFVSDLAVSPARATERVSIPATEAFTSDNVVLRGDISKPEGDGPFPAVVLMHGCGGWQPAVRYAMKAYADYLVRHGFVVLDLDSFGPRHLGGGKVCESLGKLRDARDYRTYDAYDALRYLRTQKFVDAANVFLMGQSNGGSVAINVAKGDVSQKVKEKDGGFRAVAAYYPWCGTFGSRKIELESPLIVFAGGQDDWTPASECNGVKSTGAELTVKTYPQAAHSFDLKYRGF